MDGNLYQNNGRSRRNVYEEPEKQQFDAFDDPTQRTATNPEGGRQYPQPQGFAAGYTNPPSQNIFSGEFPQQSPNQFVFDAGQRMGPYQNTPLGQGSLAENVANRNMQVNSTMKPPLSARQGSFYSQTSASEDYAQNSHQIFTSTPLTQGFYHQNSIQSKFAHKSHTFSNNQGSTQQTEATAPSGGSTVPLNASVEFDEEYIHPVTGRPVRTFLPHEQALLQKFWRLKNSFAPAATDRQVQMWQINLRSNELEEWHKFVTDNQSKRQAVDRDEAIKEYQELIYSLKKTERDKIRSDNRGNEYNRPGRKPGTKNKPKTGTPIKGASALKGKNLVAKQQVPDDDDDQDDDESDTITVEVPKKAMCNGKGKAAALKKSASASKGKKAGRQVSIDSFEDDQELIERKFMDGFEEEGPDEEAKYGSGLEYDDDDE